uniref:Bm9305 n=1 Tax=Brugia malayi TaxID=6279 RepID=A0A0H5S4E5_BRUMA|nr:Bm9305 [Brugia malayi]
MLRHLKLREDSHRRVKQRKIQLEKEDEEKRNESSIKIKQQAIKIISNRGRKVHDLPGTPVAKRTRNALGLMPIDKRLCCRGTEAFHDDNSNHLSTTLHNDNEDYLSATFHEKHLSTTGANQTACIKSSPEIAILSELETAISKKSNTEEIFPSKFNCNTPRMNNSSDTLTAISSPDKHTKQRHTGISRIDASKSRDTLRVHTSENSTSQKDAVDTDANNSLSKRSTSLNTASILERTRPDDKSVDITQRSTNATHRDKIDSDDNTIHNDITKRSTYFIHDLKCEQNIISSDDNNDSNSRNNDDLRVMSMDLKSSSCQSKSTTMHADDDNDDDDDKVKRIEEKRGKVTSTRFPGRKTLDELERQELC